MTEYYTPVPIPPEEWDSAVADCERKQIHFGELLERGFNSEEGRRVEHVAAEQAREAAIHLVETPVSRPEHVAQKLKVAFEQGWFGYEWEPERVVTRLLEDLARAADLLRQAEPPHPSEST